MNRQTFLRKPDPVEIRKQRDVNFVADQPREKLAIRHAEIKRLHCGARSERLLVNDDSFHRSATFLTRVVTTANLTYTISKWLSAVYNLSVIRDPQLFPSGKDQVQVQNTFLLTFQLGLVAKKEGPKPKTAEQLAVEAARAAAAKAAAEALDAENKLHELQRQQQQPCPPGAAVPNGTAVP